MGPKSQRGMVGFGSPWSTSWIVCFQLVSNWFHLVPPGSMTYSAMNPICLTIPNTRIIGTILYLQTLYCTFLF